VSADGVLARRPPLGTLLRALVYLALVGGEAFLLQRVFRRLIREGKTPQGPEWIRVVLYVGLIALGVWLLVRVCQIVQTWLRSEYGVVVSEDELHIRLPEARGTWSPRLKTVVLDIPLSGIRGTSFETSPKASLILETSSGKEVVPGGKFSVGPLLLEARIREAAGLKPIPPIGDWKAPTWLRIASLLMGCVLLVAPGIIATLASGDEGATGIGAVLFLPAIALFWVAWIYQGHVVIDSRGVFHERGGRLVSIARHDLRETEVGGGAFLRFLVLTSSDPDRVWVRIDLTRVLGLGFPISDVADGLEEARVHHW
jgi:hypothetical protein